MAGLSASPHALPPGQLARLKASGLTTLVAEQNVRSVSGLGDRVSILEKGMVRYHGTMVELLADDEVRQAYLAP